MQSSKKKVPLQDSAAKVAQLVERQPSKLNVAGSNPVFRSKSPFIRAFFISSIFFQIRITIQLVWSIKKPFVCFDKTPEDTTIKSVQIRQ